MAESLNIDVSKFTDQDCSEPAAKNLVEVKYAHNVLLKMLTEGLHADVKLQVKGQGKCLKAHRCVLTGVSSVFHAMFKRKMKERITSTMEIADMSMDGLELFLILLYISAGEKQVDVLEFEAAVAKHLRELILAMHKYDVANRLYDFLARALPTVLTPENCWDYCWIMSPQVATLSRSHFVRKRRHEREGVIRPVPISDGSPLNLVCTKYILQNFDNVVE